jgi:type II secretory pathway pseudopilin PulG
MIRNRKGVTLIEVMTVVVMVILVTAIAFPKLKETRRAASMLSARTQVESYLTVARSVAVRNGVRALLVRDGNTLKIVADSANTLVTVVRPIRFDVVSNIALGSSNGTAYDTIAYDNRGIATNLASAGTKFYITPASGLGAGVKDSICVTRLGLALDRNCGLAVAAKEIPVDSGGLPIDKGGGEILPPAPPTPY